MAVGMPALPFLKHAASDPDPEIAHRARRCLELIGQTSNRGTAILGAAVRVVALRKPQGSVETLLTYLPFNDDDWIEEEVLAALKTLSGRQGKTDPAFLRVVDDAFPARRAAAAFVLGRSSELEMRKAARKLLSDSDPKVRLRAAQALIAAKETIAIPSLVALVGDAPPEIAWRAEELLYRLAGGQAPGMAWNNDSAAARQQNRDTWALWWQKQKDKIDLTRLEELPDLGLTMLAEIDSNQVWEYGAEGKVRWKLENLQGPMDAQILPDGRVLVAEYQGRRVTERDSQNRIHWSKQVDSNPVACQRLPSGNTFIATHTSLMELTPGGKEVYRCNPSGLFIFGAQKLPSGRVVVIANPGVIQELDPATGKMLRTINLGGNSAGWSGIQVLPGGHYLVALCTAGKVLEVDASGRVLWEGKVPGAVHAARLPSGHVLVVSMMHRRIVELDRDGKTVKEMATVGRPWRVHHR
jgi:hypothetical protein